MALREITKKVLSLSEIPEDIREGHWIDGEEQTLYVEVHVEDGEDDLVDIWIKRFYPELVDEDSFFIHIDC